MLYRFEGQRQSIDHYGRQPGQDSQEKHEFKSLSVNPAERQAAKAAAAAAAKDDDDDVDLFGDEDEEESEQTKQRLAAYAAKKLQVNNQTSKKLSSYLINSLLEPALVAKSTIVLDVCIKKF